jgi:hypothetical protein
MAESGEFTYPGKGESMSRWRRLVLAAVGACAVLGLLASCSEPVKEGAVKGEAKKPEPGPERFIKEFEKKETAFTLMARMTDGASPHKKVRVWYSSNIKELVDKDEFAVPVGTVAMKPFDNDGQEGVDGIAVMIKKEPNFDPENGDWYYEMRDKDGNLLAQPPAGRVKMCIECHKAGAAKDYLLGTQMR